MCHEHIVNSPYKCVAACVCLYVFATENVYSKMGMDNTNSDIKVD